MQYFKFIFVILVSCLLLQFTACKSDKSDKGNTTLPKPKDEKVTALSKPLSVNAGEANAFLLEKTPILHSIIKNNAEVLPVIAQYVYELFHTAKSIKNEADLQRLFNEREQKIIPLLNEKVLNPLSTADETFFHQENGKKLNKELETIGLRGVFAEGFYMGLAAFPMLGKELEQHASEVYKWYMQFWNGEGLSQGGEYPYMNLDGYGQMTVAAEQMVDKYPEHEYTKKIQQGFRDGLNVLTDVHKVIQGGETNYIVHDLNTEFYPTATDIAAYEKLLEAHPNSKYYSVIKKITENMSTMAYVKDKGWKDLYMVVISWEAAKRSRDGGPCANARQKVYEYLDKGIDVPHALFLQKGKKRSCAVVYRFFPDKKEAEKAAATIKSQIPDIEGVVKTTFNKRSFSWKVVE